MGWRLRVPVKESAWGWRSRKGTGFSSEKRRQERPRAGSVGWRRRAGPWHAEDADRQKHKREEKWRSGGRGRAAGTGGGAGSLRGGDRSWRLESRRGPKRRPVDKAPSPNPELRRGAQRREGVSRAGWSSGRDARRGRRGSGGRTRLRGGEGRGSGRGGPARGPAAGAPVKSLSLDVIFSGGWRCGRRRCSWWLRRGAAGGREYGGAGPSRWRAGCAQRTEIAAPAPPRLPARAPRRGRGHRRCGRAAGGRAPRGLADPPPSVAVRRRGAHHRLAHSTGRGIPPLRGQLLPRLPVVPWIPARRDTVTVTRESQVELHTSVSSPVSPWPVT